MPEFSRIAEIVAVLLGTIYVVLAVRRQRACWIFGGLSSAGLTWLAATSQLPMQALLNGFYVIMAFYGYARWTRDGDSSGVHVGWWPLRWHVAGIVAVLVLGTWTASRLDLGSFASSNPWLDATTTWASLLATWLAARARIENWLYWIVIDSVLVYLYGSQGLYLVAGLFAAYLVMAVIGFRTWQRQSLLPQPT